MKHALPPADAPESSAKRPHVAAARTFAWSDLPSEMQEAVVALLDFTSEHMLASTCRAAWDTWRHVPWRNAAGELDLGGDARVAWAVATMDEAQRDQWVRHAQNTGRGVGDEREHPQHLAMVMALAGHPWDTLEPLISRSRAREQTEHQNHYRARLLVCYLMGGHVAKAVILWRTLNPQHARRFGHLSGTLLDSVRHNATALRHVMRVARPGHDWGTWWQTMLFTTLPTYAVSLDPVAIGDGSWPYTVFRLCTRRYDVLTTTCPPDLWRQLLDAAPAGPCAHWWHTVLPHVTTDMLAAVLRRLLKTLTDTRPEAEPWQHWCRAAIVTLWPWLPHGPDPAILSMVLFMGDTDLLAWMLARDADRAAFAAWDVDMSRVTLFAVDVRSVDRTAKATLLWQYGLLDWDRVAPGLHAVYWYEMSRASQDTMATKRAWLVDHPFPGSVRLVAALDAARAFFLDH
jgi:hypothetical protein